MYISQIIFSQSLSFLSEIISGTRFHDLVTNITHLKAIHHK